MSKRRRHRGSKEKRPVLFLTFSHDDTMEASCLDVSGTYHKAVEIGKECGWEGAPIFRVERQPNGEYGNERRVWSDD